MEIEQLVTKFLLKPYYLAMGAKKLAKELKTTEDNVREAKKIIRFNKLSNSLWGVKGQASFLKACQTPFPKILLLDIETAPTKAYVWGTWNQNVYFNQVISNWFVLSWSCKYLYSTTVYSMSLSPEEVHLEKDRRIMEELWKHLDNAEIIVSHNGMRFDIPKINTRFLLNDIVPPSPYKNIDTYQIASSVFGFSSNKLHSLATQLGFNGKKETTFELWKKCMEGDSEALTYLEEYNRNDVEVLEELYLRIRAWIKSHPNVNMYIDSNDILCSHCGSNTLLLLDNKYYYTQTGKYRVYRCECGALTRERKTSLEKNVVTGTSIPK